jgi:hypothetical protein
MAISFSSSVFASDNDLSFSNFLFSSKRFGNHIGPRVSI